MPAIFYHTEYFTNNYSESQIPTEEYSCISASGRLVAHMGNHATSPIQVEQKFTA